jgi:cytochrome bd-type quinol oxidase subunit 2
MFDLVGQAFRILLGSLLVGAAFYLAKIGAENCKGSQLRAYKNTFIVVLIVTGVLGLAFYDYNEETDERPPTFQEAASLTIFAFIILIVPSLVGAYHGYRNNKHVIALHCKALGISANASFEEAAKAFNELMDIYGSSLDIKSNEPHIKFAQKKALEAKEAYGYFLERYGIV